MVMGVAIVMSFVILFATTADAGERGNRQDHRHFYKHEQPNEFPNMHYRALQGLGLSDEQNENIKDLRESLKDELRKVRVQHREDIINVLTPSQRDTLKARNENRGRRWIKDRRYRDNRHEHRHRNWQQPDFFDILNTDDGIKNVSIEKTDQYATNNSTLTWGKLKNMYR